MQVTACREIGALMLVISQNVSQLTLSSDGCTGYRSASSHCTPWRRTHTLLLSQQLVFTVRARLNCFTEALAGKGEQ